MSSPIYVAIDTPDFDQAKALISKVKHHVGGIKLGLEFFMANGKNGVLDMAHLGLPIFLDLKFHDIPNTVAKAIQALRPIEPAILTVHAAGGRAMMEDAKAAGLIKYDELIIDTDVAKVSVVGIGMRSHAGVAAKMFSSLSAENINIKVISTSEIKISVLIDRKYMELAVQALHDAFDLDKAA